MQNCTEKKHCGALKEAWHLIKGMKGSYWGALSILSLIAAGGFAIIGSLLFLTNPDSFSQMLHLIYGTIVLTPHSTITLIAATPIAIIVLYKVVCACYELFFLLPIRMGVLLIPLRHAAGKPVRMSQFLEFLHWHYVWRFIVMAFFTVFIVGIPAALAVALFYAPHFFHFTLTWQIALCDVIGVILLLLSLYFVVSYTLSAFALIDRDLTPWQAMELSRKAVTKRWFCVFGALIWMGIVLIVGAALLLIGLIWAVPYAQNLFAILYRDLIGIEGRDPVTMRGE